MNRATHGSSRVKFDTRLVASFELLQATSLLGQRDIESFHVAVFVYDATTSLPAVDEVEKGSKCVMLQLVRGEIPR